MIRNKTNIFGKNTHDEVDFTSISLTNGKKDNKAVTDCVQNLKYRRNRGALVQTNKIRKECVNNKLSDHYQTLSSDQIRYPNYLKASSDLKARNYLSSSKNMIKSQAKNKLSHYDTKADSCNKKLEPQEEKCTDANQGRVSGKSNNLVSNETNHPNINFKLRERNHFLTTNINSNIIKLQSQNGDREVLRDNFNQHINNRNLKLQKLEEENVVLRKRLKTIIGSLREILINYNETDYDVKLLKNDCQKKLNSILRNSNKKSQLERKNALNSKLCLTELKKQNKAILNNLNELKECLKMPYILHFKKSVSCSIEKHRQFDAKKRRMGSFLKSPKLPTTIKQKNAPTDKSEFPTKERSEMLSEMIKFSKKIKEKGSWIKGSNLVTKTQENSSSTRILKEALELKHDLPPSLSSNTNSKKYMEMSDIQKKNCILHKPSFLKKNSIKNICKTTSNDNSQEHSKQTDNARKDVPTQAISKKPPLKSANNIKKMRKIVISESKVVEHKCQPSVLVQRDVLPKKDTDSTKLGESKSNKKCSMASNFNATKFGKFRDTLMILPETMELNRKYASFY